MITACLLVINSILTFSQDCPKFCTVLPVQEWTIRMIKTAEIGKLQTQTFWLEHKKIKAKGKECMVPLNDT